jgi:lipoyl-dependent peroxiredoxin
MTATAIDTTATVTMEPVDGAQTVTRIHLDLVATIPGADDAAFQAAAAAAKAGCPISRLLKAAEITLSARLG